MDFLYIYFLISWIIDGIKLQSHLYFFEALQQQIHLVWALKMANLAAAFAIESAKAQCSWNFKSNVSHGTDGREI